MGVEILNGNSFELIKTLPDDSIDCVVTSPPYFGLRDYNNENQYGLENTPNEYVEKMVLLFRDIHRVLRGSGTAWLNLGDTYANVSARAGALNGIQKGNVGTYNWNKDREYKKVLDVKPKNILGIPWRVAFALQGDGWYLRQDIIWARPNPMPESVKDRCTKSHEYIFLLCKNPDYYFDLESIKEPCEYEVKRHKRSVWSVAVRPFAGAHFATFPTALIEPCILAGCPEGGTVLDPFFGSGTTGVVCQSLGRNCIGFELNPTYIEIAKNRLAGFESKDELKASRIGYEDWI